MKARIARHITDRQIAALKNLGSARDETRDALTNVRENGVPGAIRPWRADVEPVPETPDERLLVSLYGRMAPSDAELDAGMNHQRDFWALRGSSRAKIAYLLEWGSVERSVLQ